MIAEAKARFARLVAGEKDAVPTDLLGMCLSLALANSDSPTQDFDALLALYKKTETIEHKMKMIASFGAICDLDIIKSRILTDEIIWNTDIVREQDLFYVLSGINGNTALLSQVRPMLWNWFKTNFSMIVEKFKNSMGIYGPYSLTFNFLKKATLSQIAWAVDSVTSTSKRSRPGSRARE